MSDDKKAVLEGIEELCKLIQDNFKDKDWTEMSNNADALIESLIELEEYQAADAERSPENMVN